MNFCCFSSVNRIRRLPGAKLEQREEGEQLPCLPLLILLNQDALPTSAPSTFSLGAGALLF